MAVAPVDITIDIDPKYQYESLYTQKSRYKDLWGGRGRGGSHEATLYALFRLTSPTYCRIAFVRKVYKDVRTSLWQDFKDRMTECNLPEDDFLIADHEMRAQYKHTGNIIKSFGAKSEGKRTAKLKSLAGYNLIIIEECDELSEDEFNTLDDSVRTIKGDPPEIIRIYNPPGRLHWIWKSYNLKEAEEKGYWRATPKSDADLLSIFSTYRDNIDNLAKTTLQKWIGYKTGNPEYYWTIIEGMISEGQRGRIFSGWEPITQARFQEIDARSVFALDFGESDPAGLVEVKFKKNKAYGRELFYKPMTVKEIGIELCKLGIDSSCLIIADSEDPLNISKLRSGWDRDELSDIEIELYPQLLNGFYIIGAIKGPGSINAGIKAMKDLKWFITEDSHNWWNEYREYKWALDKDKNPTNTPEDKNNHLHDPARYLTMGRGRQF